MKKQLKLLGGEFSEENCQGNLNTANQDVNRLILHCIAIDYIYRRIREQVQLYREGQKIDLATTGGKV